jgi:hypothetical protein
MDVLKLICHIAATTPEAEWVVRTQVNVHHRRGPKRLTVVPAVH